MQKELRPFFIKKGAKTRKNEEFLVISPFKTAIAKKRQRHATSDQVQDKDRE